MNWQEVCANPNLLECWTCDESGNMCFQNREGRLEHSTLAPDFPAKIDL